MYPNIILHCYQRVMSLPTEQEELDPALKEQLSFLLRTDIQMDPLKKDLIKHKAGVQQKMESANVMRTNYEGATIKLMAKSRTPPMNAKNIAEWLSLREDGSEIWEFVKLQRKLATQKIVDADKGHTVKKELRLVVKRPKTKP